MGQVILILYSLGLACFCALSLNESDKRLTKVELFFAIVLPIAVICGVIAYLYLPRTTNFAYLLMPMWILGVIAWFLEILDAKKLPGGLTPFNVAMAAVMAAAIFGPGLLFGFVWFYQTLQLISG